MPLLFISHASDDKKKIRPIVSRLIADGFNIWLDNPSHKDLDFSDDFINTHFQRIPAGTTWREKIGEGLTRADGVVMCWSSHALEPTERRFEWLAEARQGQVMDKLFSCRIDDFNASELKYGFSALQMADLRPGETFDKALRFFIGDIRNKITERAKSSLNERKKTKAAGNDLSPYLIDRNSQERLFARAAVEVEADGGVRPLFLMAPDNEGLERFIERVETYTMPRRLRSRQSWHKIMINWPEVDPEDFASEYRNTLVDALGEQGVLPRATDSEIKVALNNFGKPVACHSQMLATDWTHLEPRRIKAWLGWWQAMAEKPPRLSVIPLITLKMSRVEPGWTRVPAGSAEGAQVSYAEIWRAIEKLARLEKSTWLGSLFWPEEKTIPIEAPPILHPVKNIDALNWLVTCDLSPSSPVHTKATTIINQLFSSRQAKAYGISLDDFVKAVRPLFQTRG